jgi:hypothetical protein
MYTWISKQSIVKATSAEIQFSADMFMCLNEETALINPTTVTSL